MIEIAHLTKRYGDKTVLQDVSFSVKKGEVLGFLGPNGAGKTTTMNILTGYLSSDEGTVLVDGFDVLEQPFEVKKRIGYLPEQPPLYFDMTVWEYLLFVCELKKVEGNREAHIRQVLDMVHITDVQKRLIKNLSKGYKQRVGFAQALIGSPEVLVLDEPTVGLDPKQILEIRNLISELGKTHTIILSSHILPEISAICERVIILNKGRIMAVDTPETLSQKMSGECYKVEIRGKQQEIEDLLSTLPYIEKVTCIKQEEDLYTFELQCSQDGREALFYVLAEHRMPLLALQKMELSLEDIFLQLTKETEVTTA